MRESRIRRIRLEHCSVLGHAAGKRRCNETSARPRFRELIEIFPIVEERKMLGFSIA